MHVPENYWLEGTDQNTVKKALIPSNQKSLGHMTDQPLLVLMSKGILQTAVRNHFLVERDLNISCLQAMDPVGEWVRYRLARSTEKVQCHTQESLC